MATLLFRYRPLLREPQPEASAARYASDPDDTDDDGTSRDRWWYESSYDLRSGLEVNDDLGRTIPGDVFDRLFKSKR